MSPNIPDRRKAFVTVDELTWRLFRSLCVQRGTTVQDALADLVRATLEAEAKADARRASSSAEKGTKPAARRRRRSS